MILSVSLATDTTLSIQKTEAETKEVTAEKEIRFSNIDFFEVMAENGITVSDILDEKELKEALKQDLLRQGSNFITFYDSNKKVYIGINSAIVKTLKYGGKAALLAWNIFCSVRGWPMDSGIYYGMQGTFDSINFSCGHWWRMRINSPKLLSHGNQ